MSGGVIIAEIAVIIKSAYFRYLERIRKSTIPILANMKIITGSWNTTPMTKVSEVKVEM